MTDAGNDVQTNTNKQTNTLFIKGEIQNGLQQKQNTKKKNHTDPTNYYTSNYNKNKEVLLFLKCSSEGSSLIKSFCSIFLKFEWEIMFLYVLPRLFHRRHTLALKILTSWLSLTLWCQNIITDSRSSSITMCKPNMFKIWDEIFRTMTLTNSV